MDEAIFKELFEKNPDAVFVEELNGQIIECNSAACKLLGYTRKELLRLNASDLAPKKSKQALQTLAIQLKRNKTVLLEAENRKKNGSLIPVEVNLKLFGLMGKECVLAMVRDISHHKALERSLMEQKETLRRYLDITGVIMVVLDKTGRVTLINKKGCEILGRNEAAIVGKSWFSNFLPTRVRKQAREVFASIMAGQMKTVEMFENPVVNHRGQERLVVWHNAYLKDASGSIVATISSGDDVTELRATAERSMVSELRYRRLFEAAQDGVLLVDGKTGLILDVNPYLTDMLGYSKGQILNKHLWKIGTFKNVVQSKRSFVELCKKKYVRYEDLPLETKSGEQMPVEFVANEYSVGSESIIQCSIRDISARKAVETKLRESENLIRTLNNSLASSMVYQAIREKDGTVRFTYLSEAARDFYGVAPAEILRDSNLLYKRIFQDDRKRLLDAEAAAFQSLTTLKTEVRMLKPNGGVRWSSFVSNPTMLEDGTTRWDGIETDISDRKHAEDQLEQSQWKYSKLVESSNDGIVLIRNGKVDFLNDTMSRMLGYTIEQSIGKNFIDFIAPEDRGRVGKNYADRLGGKTVESRYEFRLLHADGTILPIEASVSVVGAGETTDVMAVIRDMTKTKELEKIKSDFVSTVSHQMRTPLTGVKWTIELLLSAKDEPLTARQTEHLKQVYAGNDRMIKLVDDLLNVSRIESAEKYKIDPKPQRLDKMIHTLVEDQRLLANRRRIKIVCGPECSCKSGKSGPNVLADIDRFSLAFQSVLDNAVKYSPEGGTVTLNASMKDGDIVISVTDKGVGIPKRQQSRVFERFFRADNVMTTHPGTGLGLYIAKYIVEKHSGKIWFVSEEGKGTTFFVSLPVAAKKIASRRSIGENKNAQPN